MDEKRDSIDDQDVEVEEKRKKSLSFSQYHFIITYLVMLLQIVLIGSIIISRRKRNQRNAYHDPHLHTP